MSLPYDPSSKTSIIEYGKKLKGHPLKSICHEDILNHSISGKGNFGQLLEKYYFLYELNSDSKPDFPLANLELKTTPLRKLRNEEYRSKERLVLNIIDYMTLVHQSFDDSSFWKKNASMLMVFYLHQVDVDVLDYIIKIVDEWSFPSIDLEIIKKDWQIIKDKVEAGKAHELSEGDTFYLGACTKGSAGGNYRTQPKNTLLAKQRAFSLKQGYVNHIIATLSDSNDEVYGKLIPSLQAAKTYSIEDKVRDKFAPLIGKNAQEIISALDIEIRTMPTAKHYYSDISKAIIRTVFEVPKGREVEDYVEEFHKAEVILRTVRLDEKNMPEEDVSFPTFKYEELVNEVWEESEFKAILEHKFLFVFFQLKDNLLVLKEVKFWNMPYPEIERTESVWAKTKELIQAGNIVSRIDVWKNGQVRRKTNFPGKKFNHIAHVRPHAQNADDCYPLPIKDALTNLEEYTKHCFWLNRSYVRDAVYLGVKMESSNNS